MPPPTMATSAVPFQDPIGCICSSAPPLLRQLVPRRSWSPHDSTKCPVFQVERGGNLVRRGAQMSMCGLPQQTPQEGIPCGVRWAVAERAGFEPAEVLPSHDFQSCALGRTMLPLLGAVQQRDYIIVVELCQIQAPVKALSLVAGVAWYSAPTRPTLKFRQSWPEGGQRTCQVSQNAV